MATPSSSAHLYQRHLCLGERMGLLRMASQQMCLPQGEPQINGLLKCITLLWQMQEGTERLPGGSMPDLLFSVC
jgi:hypothetical protein